MDGLAEAAQVLSSPDAGQDDRAAAQELFEQLKTEAEPLEAFASVLEHAADPSSHDELLLFHGATVLKAAVAQQARGVGSDDVLARTRNYLLQYLVERPMLFRPAREQLMACVAVLLKRAWAVDKDAASAALDAAVDVLMKGDLPSQHLGLGVFRAVLGEFSSNSRSTATGMTLEDHMIVKQLFERMQLQPALECATAAFRSVMEHEAVGPEAPLAEQVPPEAVHLAAAAVELGEAVMSWQFSTHRSRRMIGAFEHETSVYFRGDTSWQRLIRPELVQLFFGAYAAVRDIEPCAHALRQLMIQLVAVGGIFQEAAATAEYLGTAVAGAVAVVGGSLESGEATPEELLAWATLLERLVDSFSFDTIVASRGEGGAAELLEVTQGLLSEAFQHMASGSLDDGGQDGEGSGSETVNAALQAWVSMITAASFRARPEWAEGAALPFTAYVEARVAKASRDAVDDAEVREETESDEVLYEHQLTAVAAVGRLRPVEAVAAVGGLLDEKSARLAELILTPGDVDGAVLAVASEELHWMLLVSGFLLCDSEGGDCNIIPQPIMELSAESDSPDDDMVVQLSTAMLRLLSNITDVADQGWADRVSPVVLSDLLWWLSRWGRAYLLLREEQYEDSLSMSLVTAFGMDSDGGGQATEALLTEVCKILLVWHGDPSVIHRCVELLDVLTERRPVQSLLLKGEVVWTLAEGFRDSESAVGQLPAELQTHISRALCRLCSAASEADRTKLFEHIVEPTHTNFTAVLEQPDFGPELAQTADVQACVHRTVYVLRGVAQAVTEKTAELFFGYFRDVLEPIVQLFTPYANVPETCALVLQLLIDVTSKIADRLGAEGQGVLCAAVGATVERHIPNMQRLRAAGSEVGQAEVAEHALLMIRLLSAIATMQQFGGDPGDNGGGPGAVVVSALEHIIPLLSEDFLSEPQLCHEFFTLVLYLAQEFSGQLYETGALCEMVLTTIIHGIGPYGYDITRSGLESLHFIGATHFERLQAGEANPEVVEHLRSLLESLLQMFLLEPFDLRLEQNAARALFPLVCTDEEYFRHLAETLLSRQTSPELRDRLAEALYSLLTEGGLELRVDRGNQAIFVANFKSLLGSVRGFILTH